MLDLIEISAGMEGKKRVFKDRYYNSAVNALKMGTPIYIDYTEELNFNQELRANCPQRANAYSLGPTVRKLRMIQYYAVPAEHNSRASLIMRRLRIAYDPKAENNCIPGVPK